MQSIPAVTGKELIKLLLADGWEIVRRTNHGIFLRKGPRTTVIKDTSASLPTGTLLAIIGPKQTALGRGGLVALIQSS